MRVASYIEQSYLSVSLFNQLAGNIPYRVDDSLEVTDASIENQIKFIREELKETQDEFTANNPVGILDGACDLFVTVAGLLQKLEAQGYDVGQAMCRVDENNLSKFPKTLSEEDTHYYATYSNSIRYNDTFHRFAIVDRETGKVKKPRDFVPVVLDDLVPGKVRNYLHSGERVVPDTSLTAKVTWVTPTASSPDETVVLG